MGSPATDVALIGAGIMSATLGTLIQHLEPDWSMDIFEALDAPALESSNAWHNSGTGHAGFCELDYATPLPGGGLDVSAAIAINEQFHVSRQLWSALVSRGDLPTAAAFVRPTPHLAFVTGDERVALLSRWYDALAPQPLFGNLRHTDDPSRIGEWSRALVDGRAPGEPIAATYEASGTDIDFGALTRALLTALETRGARVHLGRPVTALRRDGDGWLVTHRTPTGPATTRARFVFVGAGGGSLPLLQRSRTPEVNGYGGFPVGGKFLRTRAPEVVATHPVKAYGLAAQGVPGLGAPHLDHRTVDGEHWLAFGPFASFDPRFLRSGSRLDLFRSIRPGNLGPMLTVARDNRDLLMYLVREITASRPQQMLALRRLMPSAVDADWEMIDAGKRVQVIGRDASGRPALKLGTELVISRGNNLAGILGASPGASTAVPVMIRLLKEAFPDRFERWSGPLRALVPSLGRSMNTDEEWALRIRRETAETLGLAGA